MYWPWSGTPVWQSYEVHRRKLEVEQVTWAKSLSLLRVGKTEHIFFSSNNNELMRKSNAESRAKCRTVAHSMALVGFKISQDYLTSALLEVQCSFAGALMMKQRFPSSFASIDSIILQVLGNAQHPHPQCSLKTFFSSNTCIARLVLMTNYLLS